MSLDNLPNARVYNCSDHYSPCPLSWPHFLGKTLRMQTGRKQDNRGSPRCKKGSAHPPAFTASSPPARSIAPFLTPRLLLVPSDESLPSFLFPQHQQMFNRLTSPHGFPFSGYLKVYQVPCPMHRKCWLPTVHSCMNTANSAFSTMNLTGLAQLGSLSALCPDQRTSS